MRQLIESIHDQQYPRNLQADILPVTDGKRRNRCSGVKLRARRERAAQRANPAGWDAWGHPWAFMNMAKRLLEGEDTWYHELPGGRILIAVLVRHDSEPYFFPSARALLEAL